MNVILAKELSEKYQKSQPYKHCRIEELFENSFLTNVWNELKNLEFKEKETDIYKITQTGDLMNLDGICIGIIIPDSFKVWTRMSLWL